MCDGLLELTAPQMDGAEPEAGEDEGVGMVDRLGDPDCLTAGLSGLVEVPQLRQGPGEYRARIDCGEERQPEALAGEVALKQSDITSGELDGSREFAHTVAPHAEEVVGKDRHGHVVKLRRDGDGALAILYGVLQVEHDGEEVGEKGGDEAEPTAVSQGFGEPLGLHHVVEHLAEVAERAQRGAQVEAHIDALPDGLGSLGQVLERLERLLEVPDGRAVGGEHESSGAGLAGVGHGFVPDASAEGVMRQPLDALQDEIVRPSLERFDQAPIESPTAFLEQGAESHVECQRVLERALEDREETALVEELRLLEVVHAPAQLVLRDVGDGLEQRERDVLADDGRTL